MSPGQVNQYFERISPECLTFTGWKVNLSHNVSTRRSDNLAKTFRNNLTPTSVSVGVRIHVMLAFLLLFTVVSNPSSFASDLALVHAKIYPTPTDPPIEDGTILVHNGRIRALGPRPT